MKNTLKNASPDPRHRIFKGLLDDYWVAENPSIPLLPWGPADAGALGQFLRANPTLSTDVVKTCLENRLVSEDHAPAERVHRWIGDLLRYASGPLNRFKQPMRASSMSAEAQVGVYIPGKSWTGHEPIETIRSWMSKEWFDRACQLHAEGRPLTDLERDCLREEGIL